MFDGKNFLNDIYFNSKINDSMTHRIMWCSKDNSLFLFELLVIGLNYTSKEIIINKRFKKELINCKEAIFTASSTNIWTPMNKEGLSEKEICIFIENFAKEKLCLTNITVNVPAIFKSQGIFVEEYD